MSRPVRIEYKGACYHIIARGIERRKVFLHLEDKFLLLEILAEVKKTHGLTIHGYCLMDNHYHLQFETPRGNLCKAMTRLQGIYCNKYNAVNKRSGHVFEGRYKSYLIDKVDYLLEASRYLHLNPVRARMVERPEQYKWSSYEAFIGKTKGELVDPEWILSRFERKKRKAEKEYREYVMEKINDGSYNPFQAMYGGYILGKESFVEKVKERFGKKKENEGPGEGGWDESNTEGRAPTNDPRRLKQRVSERGKGEGEGV